MIARIMLFKLADGVAAAEVAESVRGALAGLGELLVASPHDPVAIKSWDLCAELRFADVAAHDRALASPALRELLEETLASKVQVSKAWSFAQK